MVCLSALCTTIYETYMLNKYCYQHTSVYKCIPKKSTYNLHIYISNDGLWFALFPVMKRRKYQSRLSVCYFTRNGSDVSSITYKPTTSELVHYLYCPSCIIVLSSVILVYIQVYLNKI